MLIKRLTVISVKLTSSVIATAKDEKEALRIHNKNSRTHEKLLKEEYPYWNPLEVEDGDLMFVEPEMEPLPCNNHVELGNVVDIDMVNAEFEMNDVLDAKQCFG
jgi:hypothetical protein